MDDYGLRSPAAILHPLLSPQPSITTTACHGGSRSIDTGLRQLPSRSRPLHSSAAAVIPTPPRSACTLLSAASPPMQARSRRTLSEGASGMQPLVEDEAGEDASQWSAPTDADRQMEQSSTTSTPLPGPSCLLRRPTKPEPSLSQRRGRDASSDRPGPFSSKRLSAALSDLRPGSAGSASSASRLTALASPCFYHKRFDDAVNIDRVLEEIEAVDGMSHSRLMKTATGVREVSKQLQRRPIKQAVRSVMIVTKARDNHLVTLTRELAEWLLSTPRYGSDVGVNVYVDAKLKNSKRFGVRNLLDKNPRFEEMLRFWTPDLCWTSPEKFDLVLTLGGDGTVLFTSWLFQRIVPPVLSFSLGSLGFLTTFEFERYRAHLDAVMGDAGMRVNLRMRFTCTVYRTDPRDPGAGAVESEQFEVLNELVIDRGPSPYVSNLELFGDEALLTVVQADGCIFSTPTGSTAYSLSAGGSLVHPDIPAILLTPICPHTLSFRPMLLNDTMLLRVAVPRNSRATAYCAFDGKGRVELRQGDYVTIAASQYPFPTVLSKPTEWFDSISSTLRWNTRGGPAEGLGRRRWAGRGRRRCRRAGFRH